MSVNPAGVLGALTDADVDVILIGGFAGQAHGSARLTQDIDFIYRRTPQNIERLAAALKPYKPYPRGAPPNLPFRFDAPTIERGLNFTLTTTLGDVDLLGEMTGGGTYDEVRADTDELSVFGRRILVLNLPALIKAKRAAGRPKDFEALAELEALLVERERSG